MAGFLRTSGIESRAGARLRRAAASMSRRTAVAGMPFKVEGGVVVSANKVSAADGRFSLDGIFVEYATSGATVFSASVDETAHTSFILADPGLLGRVLDVTWNETDSRYELNLFSTVVPAIACETGEFDYVVVNSSGGPGVGVPGAGECVCYVETSGGVDYLRVKFNSGAVREIANSSHNLVQFDGIGINGGIPSAGEIAFDTAGTIYSGGGLLTGNLTLACRGVSGDIILVPAGEVIVDVGLTIGTGAAGTDYALTFDGETNDGVLTWMEDEDYFLFSDDLLVAAGESLYFRDTAIHVTSAVDGCLDITADLGIRHHANTHIDGNYFIAWRDLTDTTTYAYMIATTAAGGGFVISAVNVPFELRYGALGSIVQLSMDASGNLVFNYGAGDCDFSIMKQTAGVAYAYDAGNDTHSFGDGGATNYTRFDATGHQTMAGSAKPWDDLRVEPVARTTGANAPTFEKWLDDSGGTSRGVYLYSFDDAVGGSEKEVFFSMQMPHNWDGGEIHLHVHWIGAVDDTTAAPRWGLEYAWKDVGQVFGDTTIVYSDGSNYTDTGTDANVAALKHYISKFSALVPGTSADGISSVLIGRLFRDSADAGDTYNAAGAKCGLLYIDAHYQLARVGSTDEYTA